MEAATRTWLAEDTQFTRAQMIYYRQCTTLSRGGYGSAAPKAKAQGVRSHHEAPVVRTK